MIKFLLKLFQTFPDEKSYENWEIFNHEKYLLGDEIEKKRIRRETCLARYNIEKNKNFSWFEKYFLPYLCKSEIVNKTVLDLGCFTGGRLIAWAENYHFKKSFGIDINNIFKIAGSEFSKEKNINAEFLVSKSEELPFDNNSFDLLFSTDTFEHVENLELTMNECYRVLNKSGKLLAVFPQYLQPFESHLNFVTKLPFLHWFFDPKKISVAYFQILKERGESAKWYTPQKKYLEKWEKLPSLNGTSVNDFRKILKKNNWSKIKWIKNPILSDGRKSNYIFFKILSKLFYPFCHIKYLDELFLGRICVICEK